MTDRRPEPPESGTIPGLGLPAPNLEPAPASGQGHPREAMGIYASDSMAVIRCALHDGFVKFFRAGSDGMMPVRWLADTITAHLTTFTTDQPRASVSATGLARVPELDAFGQDVVKHCVLTTNSSPQGLDPSWPELMRLAVAFCLDLPAYLGAGLAGQPGCSRTEAADRLIRMMAHPPADIWAWAEAVNQAALAVMEQQLEWTMPGTFGMSGPIDLGGLHQ